MFVHTRWKLPEQLNILRAAGFLQYVLSRIQLRSLVKVNCIYF